jgi:DNA polymerase III delta prime subunit
MSTEEAEPWVEKYRPTQFDHIVLDASNRNLFRKIIDKQYFPNLLFYGPPGTGKTTTVINLINEFQTKHYGRSNKSNVIHLNASDERGIDIIRNQIHSFVRTLNLFDKGFKFVILDEVDYMTRNAQHALKYLLQTTTMDVRFCLICNYISKIDAALQNEFICVRFNQLPKHDIYQFIRKIATDENMAISSAAIDAIQTVFRSDIRSMINFLQLHQNIRNDEEWIRSILSDDVLEELHQHLHYRTSPPSETVAWIYHLSRSYNVDKRHIFNTYFFHVLRHYPDLVTLDWLDRVEVAVHTTDARCEDVIHFLCTSK